MSRGVFWALGDFRRPLARARGRNQTGGRKLKANHKREANGANSPIATAGEVFADGGMIELIAGASEESPRLLHWDGAKETVSSIVEHGGRSYEPAVIDRSILRELRLPTRTTSPGSTRELLSEICTLVTKFVGLAEKPVSIVGRVIL